MAELPLRDRDFESKKEDAEVAAGKKDRKWQCHEHETTLSQKGQYGELNVIEWATKKKTAADSTEFQTYFTNLLKVMKENN
jgi:hypothetical protein